MTDYRDKTPAGKAPEGVWVDHETGLIHIPGMEPREMVGPTSGKEYQQFKAAEKEQSRRNIRLRAMMQSTYQCVQCKRKMKGAKVLVKYERIDGKVVEVFTCMDRKCAAPVVMIEDALSLTSPPRENGGSGR